MTTPKPTKQDIAVLDEIAKQEKNKSWDKFREWAGLSPLGIRISNAMERTAILSCTRTEQRILREIDWIGDRMFECYMIGMQAVLYDKNKELEHFERHRKKCLQDLKSRLHALQEKQQEEAGKR